MEVPPTSGELEEHVREIIESPAFRGSRRSQQFLQFVIEKTVSGQGAQLKERSLGIELFGRPASYDTGEDAIVRVTASDVRKRLHQFYAESGLVSRFRIDLPSGSYVPDIRRHAAEAVPPRPATRPERRRIPGWLFYAIAPTLL